MGDILMTGGGGGGTGSDECTDTLDHVLAGETAVTSDSNDEPGTGRMTVNSLLSFSVAAYSGRRVLAKWQNPKAAAGKPYSGVYIRYSTSGYPGKTGGVQIYKGAGNNTASEGQSQQFLDMPNLNTTYYFSIYPYVTCSTGEMTGNIINSYTTTSGSITQTFTGTTTYMVQGFTKMDVFLVGGGGGGGYAGGAGGRTAIKNSITIASGDTLAISVGNGGGHYSTGGTSSVSRNGSIQISAGGGNGAGGNYGDVGGSGGSGGGSMDLIGGKSGGSDGSNGTNATRGNFFAGSGQGTTTRAWGSPTGTLYSGGGGGGSHGYSKRNNEGDTVRYFGLGGSGGSGGGGTGGGWTGYDWNTQVVYAVNGSANTGGGGGGRPSSEWGTYNPAYGGSGIVLINFY